MALQVGSRLGHYSVTALIGEGGMGQVYQATDTKLNRQVALKILPEAFADDPDRLARFQREAQVFASLNHPNIAAIYGVEKAGDTRAVVFELVEGPTLVDLIAEGPMPMEQALAIAKGVEDALKAAHDHGIVHGDLTPAHVTITKTSRVKVLGFGCGPVASDDPQVDTEAFEAMCERLLGMKTPSKRSALPTAIQESGPGRRPVPLAAWRWSWRLAGVVLSLALASSLVGLFWPRTVVAKRSLVWVDHAGNEQPIAAEAAAYVNPRLSPDGSMVAVEVASDDYDIWIINLRSNDRQRLTHSPERETHPLWTPDGELIVFSRTHPLWAPDGQRVLPSQERPSTRFPSGLFSKAANGRGPARPLVSIPGVSFTALSWSGDRGVVVMSVDHGGENEARHDIGVVSTDGNVTRHPLLAESHTETDAALSPNGELTAYVSDRSGHREVYSRPFPEGERGRWQISTGSGEDPLWSPDGRRLFYRSPAGMMAVRVESERSVSFGAPEFLFEDLYYCCDGRSYDVTPDGRRFLMLKPEASSAAAAAGPGRIGRNWLEKLKRLVPLD